MYLPSLERTDTVAMRSQGAPTEKGFSSTAWKDTRSPRAAISSRTWGNWSQVSRRNTFSREEITFARTIIWYLLLFLCIQYTTQAHESKEKL